MKMYALEIYTVIAMLLITLVAMFMDGLTVILFVVASATFCIFEGIIHVVGIKILGLKKPYSPGLVTAEIELVTGVGLIVYLAVNHIGAWYDYTFGPFVFLACFVCMQRSMMAMIGGGIGYKDVLANVRRRLASKE